MKFCQLSFFVKREESELAAYIAQFVTNASVALYDKGDLKELNIEYIEESVKNALPFQCLIKCCCGTEEIESVKANLKEELNKALLREVDIVWEIIDEQSYIDKWKEDFVPIKVKNIVVKPKGYTGRIYKNCKIIEIDTSMAFGTGKHETTYLMLDLMQNIDFEGKSFLDIGCGSGILSVAAAALGAKSVLALDNDGECVKTAKENAANNNFGEEISVIQSDLVQGVSEYFDIIVANITFDILKILYKDIDKFIKKGGILLLSGILKEQGKDLKALYGGKFKFLKEKNKGIWSAFMFGG